MFAMSYQLVPDRYLRTKRGNGNAVLGNFIMQDEITQTKSTQSRSYHQKPIPGGNVMLVGGGRAHKIRIDGSIE